MPAANAISDTIYSSLSGYTYLSASEDDSVALNAVSDSDRLRLLFSTRHFIGYAYWTPFY